MLPKAHHSSASLLASKKPSRALPAVLALEFITRSLRRNASPAAQLERQEYASRDKDMLWYLLRDSIWRDFTRLKLDAVAERTLRTPIVGLFGSLLKDWIPLIDEYYYCELGICCEQKCLLTLYCRYGALIRDYCYCWACLCTNAS